MIPTTKKEDDIVRNFLETTAIIGKDPFCAIYFGNEISDSKEIGRIGDIPIIRQSMVINDDYDCPFYPVFFTNNEQVKNDQYVKQFRVTYSLIKKNK